MSQITGNSIVPATGANLGSVGYFEPPPVAATVAPTLGPADVMRIIKQRKLTIIIVGILTYGLVVAATFLIKQYAPQYTSKGLLQLDPPVGDTLRQEDRGFTMESIKPQLYAEAARIKSLEFLFDVVAQPEVKATEYYKWYGSADQAAFGLLKDLAVVPSRESPVIEISLAAKIKNEPTKITDLIMTRYVSEFRSGREKGSGEQITSLKKTLADIDGEMRKKQDEVVKMRREHQSGSMESDRLVHASRIAQLQQDIGNLRNQSSLIESEMEGTRGVDPRNLPATAEIKVIAESDPVLRFYRQQVEQLDIQIEAAKATNMGENHVQMKRLKELRDGYSDKETARRDEVIGDLRSRRVETLSQQREQVRGVLLETQDQLAEAENRLRELDTSLQEIDRLTKEGENLQRQYEQVAMSLRQSEQRADLEGRQVRLRIISRPKDAIEPSRPNLPLYLGGGFFLALLAGVGVAFLRELTDKAIRTPIDVARYGQLSVLGSVPLLDDEEADVESIETATRLAPQSLVAESFRQIRAHLTFSGPTESQRTLLITSPGPGDGKTAVAVNLAVSFAQGNQRVLLIDGNFRRPAIRAVFSSAKADGLSNILIGQTRLENSVTPTDVPNLHVLSSGPMPPNPGELLQSQAMRDFLAAAKSKYDRVIIDGPPCLLMSDALIVATLVDGVIVVARAVTNSKGVLKRAREQLDRTGARVLGAILNGVQAQAGGYFRQQYREFYEYTSDETVPRELLDTDESRP